MRILYLVYWDLINTELWGVKKKIFSQTKALRKIGHEADIGFCSGDTFIIRTEEGDRKFPIKKGISKYRRDLCRILQSDDIKSKYDVIYVRFPGSIDYYVFKAFRIMKKQGQIGILELPTYPIGGELKKRLKAKWNEKEYMAFMMKLMIYGIHRVLSRQLYRYIDKIVTFMPYENVWHSKTVVVDNGIDIEEYQPSIPSMKDDKELVLLGVANVAIWHGYDRVINGLYNYYREDAGNRPNVIFKIAGGGTEIDNLKEQVDRLKLNGKVEFLGLKSGEALTELYRTSNIGISSLGMHRIGLSTGSTLKTKEYCAIGLPFIYSYKEKAIDSSFEFARQFEPDDSAIDIHEVIAFYDSISKQKDYSAKMYEFAKNKFDWEIQMRKIFD